MRLRKALLITGKDLLVFRRRRTILSSTLIFPLLVAVGLPLIISIATARRGIAAPRLEVLLDAFSFLFVIIAAYIPIAISAYSLVGEKIEKSLEPLLAAPITDDEVFLGKSIASFVPSILATYASALIFMAFTDFLTKNTLNRFYFPNWTIGIMLLVLVPLTTVLSIEIGVLISSKANDARSAQTQGLLFGVLPFAAIYILNQTGTITLNTSTLLIIAAIILMIDIMLYSVSSKIFRREEILTRWV